MKESKFDEKYIFFCCRLNTVWHFSPIFLSLFILAYSPPFDRHGVMHVNRYVSHSTPRFSNNRWLIPLRDGPIERVALLQTSYDVFELFVLCVPNQTSICIAIKQLILAFRCVKQTCVGCVGWLSRGQNHQMQF